MKTYASTTKRLNVIQRTILGLGILILVYSCFLMILPVASVFAWPVFIIVAYVGYLLFTVLFTPFMKRLDFVAGIIVVLLGLVYLLVRNFGYVLDLLEVECRGLMGSVGTCADQTALFSFGVTPIIIASMVLVFIARIVMGIIFYARQ